ncbi:MAG TPA: MarR family winged helix-turn-helix transcriptional regulator [Bacillota bacterium]|nr:MarR family winged helix-turn-helix transcriptional regulator [Bacillota bacterium]
MDRLSGIYHKLYYKMVHSKYEAKFPLISGLSGLEMGVLGVLSDFPDANLKEICARLAISKSTLTSAVNRLVSRGYVNRAVNASDRRSFTLTLTETGRRAQHEHIASERAIYAKILAAMASEQEVEQLLNLFEKIAEEF